jgi:hypothetical protein
MIIRNITPRKQAELKLQRQLQRERLFNQLIQAINTSLDLPTLFDVAVREVGGSVAGSTSYPLSVPAR